MALVVLPKREPSWQPPLGNEINWGHPLAHGLRALVLPFAGAAYDLVAGRAASDTTRIYAAKPSGVAHRDWSIPAGATPDLDWTSGPFSVGVFCHVQAHAGGYPLPVGRTTYVSESNNQGWGIDIGADNDANASYRKRFRFNSFRNNGNANYVCLGSTQVTNGRDYSVVATSDTVTRRIFVNGLQEGTSTANTTPLSASSATFRNVSIDDVSGRILNYITCCWGRLLTADEVQWFKEEPFCMLVE